MTLEVVLITGMAGSGKSVALHALEDAGYYCVDNLPPELLAAFVALEHQHHGNRIAIAMDVRSATALPLVPQQLKRLRSEGVVVHSLFLDATTDTLIRRFSETRRRHPSPETNGRKVNAHCCKPSSWKENCWPNCVSSPMSLTQAPFDPRNCKATSKA